MHLFPELVREDLIVKPNANFGDLMGLPTAGLNAVKFQGVDINLAVDITDRIDNGIDGGDPTHSSAEVGEQIADYLVDFTTAFLKHFSQADTLIQEEGETE